MKLLFSAAVAIVIAGTFDLLAAQSGSGKPALDAHGKRLAEATQLTISFTTQQMPGAAEPQRLSFAKPDKLMIETPTSIVSTNGVTMWTYDKADNTYIESPGGIASALTRARLDDSWAWAAFFSAEALKSVKNPTLGAKRNIKGHITQEISMTLGDGRACTLFIDQKLGIARGAAIKSESGEILVIASEISFEGEQPSFDFTPPAGAQKLDKPKEQPATWSAVSGVIQARCMPCHGSANKSGGYDLSAYAGASAPPLVVAGDPPGSLLYGVVSHTRGARMPKFGAKIPDAEISLIERWIKDGAKP